MKWIISKEIDSDSECNERMRFYSKLGNCELKTDLAAEKALKNYSCYVFSDSFLNNCYMIVGHTDFAISIITLLKNIRKRKRMLCKIYVCACIMSYEYFRDKCGLDTDDEVYFSIQELVEVEECEYYTCEFLCKHETKLGFRATKSELCLLNAMSKSFHRNLRECFIYFGKYRNTGVVK